MICKKYSYLRPIPGGKYKRMIDRLNKKDCCGCTTCYNSCPAKAIQMKADEEGFMYPIISKKLCITCGKCEHVCPVINSLKIEGIPLAGYVVRNKDHKILYSSASGGFFSAIAEYVLNRGGIVYGAAFDKNFKVCHMAAESTLEVQKFRSSKYVQSDLGDIFTAVEKNLKNSRLICFSGTPCQIEGLKRFLNKEYDNLITVDLVCHGVPSPDLWEQYLEWQTRKKGSKVVFCNFRNKTYGYHNGTLEIVFENGRHYYGSSRNDMMIKSFFSEIASRPSCYNCAFKKIKHSSDFTVFDCWHAADITLGVKKDDDKGYTNLLVNSNRGRWIFEYLKKDFEIYEADIEKMIKYDGVMVQNSSIPHKDRDVFYLSLNQNGIEKTVQTYIPISEIDRIMVRFRTILYKLGLLNVGKAIVRAIRL